MKLHLQPPYQAASSLESFLSPPCSFLRVTSWVHTSNSKVSVFSYLVKACRHSWGVPCYSAQKAPTCSAYINTGLGNTGQTHLSKAQASQQILLLSVLGVWTQGGGCRSVCVAKDADSFEESITIIPSLPVGCFTPGFLM